MAETVRTWNKIGIIGAMDVEVEKLKADMKGVSTAVRAGMEFCEGELKGKQAVVVRSGIGKVNAAVCTQILADLFSVDCVINTGIAGSLDARIDIGDIVISTDVAHHDMDAVNFGYPLGQIPQMDVFSFRADEDLARLAGLMCGISSGTNVAAALQLAKKLGKGKTVVTVLPDTAERYFSTPLFENETK